MLMKQQDRLEEREQDIEDQLYKLESDKRLVEVAKPKPVVWGGEAWVQGLGLVPYLGQDLFCGQLRARIPWSGTQ